MRCATEVGNVNDQALFVFQRDDPRQNGVKLLTPVSDLHSVFLLTDSFERMILDTT